MKRSALNRRCDVPESRWASSNRRSVWNRSAFIFKVNTTSTFHLSKRRGNHSPNDTESCPRIVELSATPQRRPRTVPRVISFHVAQTTTDNSQKVPYSPNQHCTNLTIPTERPWRPLPRKGGPLYASHHHDTRAEHGDKQQTAPYGAQ